MVYLKEQDIDFPWNHNFRRPSDWACDECLANQFAEKAQFEQAFLLTDMHHSMTHWGYPSQYFYFDYKLVCDSCDKEFVYYKGEQRWFRESLVLYAESTLRECKACRLEKRQRNRIDHLIHLTKTDPDPFQYLEIVTDLMLRFSDPRTLEYLRRAKNKAPTPQQRRKFEEKIALLKEVK